jgi:hypothetical protein
VNAALAAQKPEGYWLKGDEIDAGEFTKHMNAMAMYVEGARQGGGAFAKQRGQD